MRKQRITIMIKKSIALLLALFFCGSSMAYAAGGIELSEKELYIRDVLRSYLRSSNANSGMVRISNAFSINGNSDINLEMYLVSVDGKYSGRLLLSQDDSGRLISSYYDEENSYLNAMINGSHQTAAFYLENERLAVQNGAQRVFISSNGYDFVSDHRVSFEEVSVQLRDLFYYEASNNRDYYISLNVPYVANDEVNGDGICWAASVAMVSNYRINTSYTAMNIYNMVSEIYPSPSGSATDINAGFMKCGLTHAQTGRMDFFTLFNILQQGRPVIFHVFPHAFSLIGHDLVLKSLEGGDAGPIYGFRDCNDTASLYVFVADSSGSSFPIQTNSKTYNNWRNSFY